jgi:hypothetical protein
MVKLKASIEPELSIRKLLLSKQSFPWQNSIESGGGLPVLRSGYRRPHSIARDGGIPMYPAV